MTSSEVIAAVKALKALLVTAKSRLLRSEEIETGLQMVSQLEDVLEGDTYGLEKIGNFAGYFRLLGSTNDIEKHGGKERVLDNANDYHYLVETQLASTGKMLHH